MQLNQSSSFDTLAKLCSNTKQRRKSSSVETIFTASKQASIDATISLRIRDIPGMHGSKIDAALWELCQMCSPRLVSFSSRMTYGLAYMGCGLFQTHGRRSPLSLKHAFSKHPTDVSLYPHTSCMSSDRRNIYTCLNCDASRQPGISLLKHAAPRTRQM